MQLSAVYRVALRDRKDGIRAWFTVDLADAPFIRSGIWMLTSRGYVKGDRRHRWQLLHRLLMGCEVGDGRYVDHVNGNSLDNRRSNLRLVSAQANSQNLHVSRGASGRLGVHRCRDRWKAKVKIDGEEHYLGVFDDPDEAAEVVRAFRAEHLPHSREAREATASRETGSM